MSTTTDGNRYRWVRNTVTRYAADGRIEAQEFFPESRWDDAVGLFDEWSAGHETSVPTSGFVSMDNERDRRGAG